MKPGSLWCRNEMSPTADPRFNSQRRLRQRRDGGVPPRGSEAGFRCFTSEPLSCFVLCFTLLRQRSEPNFYCSTGFME